MTFFEINSFVQNKSNTFTFYKNLVHEILFIESLSVLNWNQLNWSSPRASYELASDGPLFGLS